MLLKIFNPKRSRFIHFLTLPTILLLLITALVMHLTNATEVQAHLYAGYSVLDHAIPVPPGTVPWHKIPCDNPGYDPEFHSLRPYQASPCGDSPKMLYCWNNYLLYEGLTNKWDPSTCTPGGGYWSCTVDQEIEKVYTVDGEYATFPIMGNTEKVMNSQGP